MKLERKADEYEDWVVGILDQVEQSIDAVDLLTCTPARRDPRARGGFGERSGGMPMMLSSTQAGTISKSGGRWVSLWAGSVLDEAAKSSYPCRRILAHRHCQFVLEQYFAGVSTQRLKPSTSHAAPPTLST